MKKVVWILIAALFFLSSCIIPPGQIKKHSAPGQIKKITGKNPASWKKK
jgi:starvation-inducible outer membrane lipoprotein